MAFKINFSGLNKVENSKYFSEDSLKEKLDQFSATISNENIGFFNITDTTEYIEECRSVLPKFAAKKNFIQEKVRSYLYFIIINKKKQRFISK